MYNSNNKSRTQMAKIYAEGIISLLFLSVPQNLLPSFFIWYWLQALPIYFIYPPTHNKQNQDTLLSQHFFFLSSHSLFLSEIQQCSGNATGFLLFPLLCFLLLCNNTILVLFYRGKEVDFIHSCLIYSVCVFRKEKLMQVKWNPLEHQIECHLKWYF